MDELKARLCQIPGELSRLRVEVSRGDVSYTAAEPLRRLLEGEARSAKQAIDAAGVATVAEVERARAVLIEATRGCAECRARVVAALREAGG